MVGYPCHVFMTSNRKGKKGNVLKVVELGLQDKVYTAMKQIGFSAASLARELRSEGIEITAQSIRKFIKKTKKAQQQLIQTDLKASNEVIKLSMNYNKALNDILKEVEEVKNTAKDKKDYITYNQLIGRLLQGIELFAKLTGDMKPKGSVDINIIYNEITTDIENKMKNLKNNLHSDSTIVDVEFEVSNEDTKIIKEKGEKND